MVKVFLGLILVLSFGIRVRLFDLPLERDEGEYAYAGQLIRQGVPPYRAAYNMKLPGTYLAYAGIMSAAGESPRGIRIGLAVVNALSAGAVFVLVAAWWGEFAALAAAALFAVLSMGFSVLGMHAHATHFVICPVLWGLVALRAAVERRAHALAFSAGFLIGLGVLCKQQGSPFVLMGVAFAAMESRRAALTVAVLAGSVTPYLLTCAWLGATGDFGRFWFWTVSYASQYVSQVPAGDIPLRLWESVESVADVDWPAWLLACAGFAVAARDSVAIRRRWILLFTGFAFLAVCPGFYFRPHYWVVFLPAVSILGAIALAELAKRTATTLAVAAAGAAIGYSVLAQQAYFFTSPPEEVIRAEYGEAPFAEAIGAADHIRASSAADARVAVLGSEPEIYFYSRRRSATGHIYVYGLMEDQPLAPRMQQEAIREIEAAQPEFIVYAEDPYSWLEQKKSHPEFGAWIARYLPAHYFQERRFAATSSSPGLVVWKRRLR